MSLLAAEIVGLVVGLLLGSFLNVCIVRVPRGESVVSPGSRCLGCGHAVRWFDNVPVVSWVVLKGKCRDCGERISWLYPAVELAVGALFCWISGGFVFAAELPNRVSSIARQAGYLGTLSIPPTQWWHITILFLGIAILGFLLIGLMVMDWQTHTLPDAFTLTGTLIGFVLVFVQAAFLAPGEGDIHFDPQRNLRLSSPGSFVAKGDVFMTGPEHIVLGRLLAIVLAAGLLLLIRWVYLKFRGREGLGLGDAKLLALIAAFLGFWPAMLALFVGIVSCSGYAVVLMARRRATAVTRLPLGTFLCVGGLVAVLWGDSIIAWYTSLISTSAVLPS